MAITYELLSGPANAVLLVNIFGVCVLYVLLLVFQVLATVGGLPTVQPQPCMNVGIMIRILSVVGLGATDGVCSNHW